jgi:hypothetical protein
MTTATGLEQQYRLDARPIDTAGVRHDIERPQAVSAVCNGRRAGKASHKQKEDGRGDDIVGRE